MFEVGCWRWGSSNLILGSFISKCVEKHIFTKLNHKRVGVTKETKKKKLSLAIREKSLK